MSGWSKEGLTVQTHVREVGGPDDSEAGGRGGEGEGDCEGGDGVRRVGRGTRWEGEGGEEEDDMTEWVAGAVDSSSYPTKGAD